MSIRSLLILFFALAFLFACVPVPQGSKLVTCKSNQSFDPVKRVCYDVYIPPLPPVPTLDSVDIAGETATTVTLKYTDNKNELARFCSVTPGLNLSATTCTCVNGTCTTSVTSDYLYFGQTTLTYNLTDNDGTSSDHVVTVNVSAKNHAPVASNGVLSTAEDTPGSGTLAASDVDPWYLGIGTLYYELVSSPTYGSVSVNALTGNYTYTPYVDFNGSDVFTFKVRDGGTPVLYSDTATVTVGVTPVNDAPSMASLATQTESGSINTVLNFTLSPGNDVDGDTLTYSLITSPSYGTLSGCLGISGAAGLNCVYTPNVDVSDDDRYAQAQIGGLHYVAKTLGTSGNSIRIIYSDDLASAGGETVSVSGSTITVHMAAGKTSSSQIRSALISSVSASALVGTYLRGSIYEAAADQYLAGGKAYTDFFDYQANDGTLDSPTTATVVVSLTSTLSAPVIGADQAVSVDQNDTVTFVLNLATDKNYKDSLTYWAVDTSSLHGTLSGCLAGSSSLICTYTPDKNYSGAASFTYQALDSSSQTSAAVATVSITVADVPQSPVLCQYSSFEEANECGPTGCIGTASPVGKILPAKTGLYYYQKEVAICWKSTGLTANDWTDISSTEGNHIADQTINEKDQVVVDTIRIDEGGGSGEDTEQVQVTSIELTKISGDNGLLNTSSFTFYYNSVLTSLATDFGSAVTSSDLADLKMVINPVGGKSGVVKVNLVITDTTSATTGVSFYVTVNPVSVQHKGWADVQAIGPKVSKDADILSPTYPCTYSRYNCTISGKDTQACTGTFVPTASTASTSEQYAVFYNSSSNKCYYNSSAAGSAASWVEFQTVCNISSSYGYSFYGTKASLIGSGAPSFAPVNKNDFYYDLTNDVCYRSLDTSASSDWVTYTQTTPVTFAWDSFLVSGSGSISGYNVYRRLAGTSFNYKSPLNKLVLAATATSYTDNSTNSWMAPAPKTVYEYEVRPVINSISTAAYGYSQTLKVSVPDDNMALVHRWIANRSMCNKLHASLIDTQNNYRCAYQGPGDNGAGYYDIGSDFFVDVYEAGCNYSSSPICSTTDGTCVGISSPNTALVTANVSGGTAYYYDRSSGKCYYTATGGVGSWAQITGAESFVHNYPELPPAVYVTQSEANTFCSSKNVSNILGAAGVASGQLPNRKMQMAYGEWSSSLANSVVNSYESGQGLNSSPKCNSYNANGLTSYYSDVEIPDSNTIYTLPGTNSSGIRSMITGSSKTSSCQSRYGVRDTVGNVSEWVQDRVKCTAIGSCEGAINTTVGVTNLDSAQSMLGLDSSLGGSFQFKIGDSYGPYAASPYYPSGACNDTDADSVCNNYLSTWLLSNGDYSASRLWVAMGLPGNINFTTSAYSTSEVAPWLFTIGATAGIQTEALHGDQVTTNTHYLYADTTGTAFGCGSMAIGGSYASGSKAVSGTDSPAGLYNFELVPCQGGYGYLLVNDITFKALSSLETNPVYIDFVSGVGEAVSTSTSGSTRYISLTYTSTSTANSIVSTVNADVTASAWVYASVSGNGSNAVSTLSSTAMISTSAQTSSRSDIGFRCAYPLP